MRDFPMPRVVGHRGVRGHAPENTLAGFRRAAEMGVRAVEFDVRRAADALVVIHDADLDRTTDGKGLVAAHTWAELEKLDAGAWFGAAFAGARLATLETVLDCLAELGLSANVEIKADDGAGDAAAFALGAEVAARVAERWPQDRPAPLLSSFDGAALAGARSAVPGLARGLLFVRVPREWRARLEALDCTSLHAAHDKLDEQTVAAAHAGGWPVLVYTVNDPAAAARMDAWGVDAQCTDYPERLALT
ncbi:MAG TPA: glycerophosphodiester phosphodiesterase family protein [Planctomycetota bacterium]